jgi:hypothetical protein
MERVEGGTVLYHLSALDDAVRDKTGALLLLHGHVKLQLHPASTSSRLGVLYVCLNVDSAELRAQTTNYCTTLLPLSSRPQKDPWQKTLLGMFLSNEAGRTYACDVQVSKSLR